jgi:hypothetical protein
MMDEAETVFATVEEQNPENVDQIKRGWEEALCDVRKVLHAGVDMRVAYNPLIWRVTRYPVGLRLLSGPWGSYAIIEFSTPNGIIYFDCFSYGEAKHGVLAHEIAHIIDDKHWKLDKQVLIRESEVYVTREQRAELIAFTAFPLGILHANRSLIESTTQFIGYRPADLKEFLEPFVFIETLGRMGMPRTDDLPLFFREMKNTVEVPIERLLGSYISTNLYSLAGLVTSPGLNTSNSYGIKQSAGLYQSRQLLCDHLMGKLSSQELIQHLLALNYTTTIDGSICGYRPMEQIPLHLTDTHVISTMLDTLPQGPWECYNDMRRALEMILEHCVDLA